MRTLGTTTLILLVAAALTGALYWGFLSTPESTAWMLGLSAVLAVASLSILASAVNAVLLAWTGRGLGAATWRQAVVRLPAGVPPALLIGAAWWLVLRGEAWTARYSGEISAWFIATLGWSDVRWLFGAVAWIGLWLRWVVAPFAALVWWRRILDGEWRPSGGVLRSALHPLGILTATVLMAALVYAPWVHLVPWRPSALTPGTLELVFVATKLGLVAVLAAVGWTLVARTAVTPRN